MKREKYEVYITLNGRIIKRVNISKESDIFNTLLNSHNTFCEV